MEGASQNKIDIFRPLRCHVRCFLCVKSRTYFTNLPGLMKALLRLVSLPSFCNLLTVFYFILFHFSGKKIFAPISTCTTCTTFVEVAPRTPVGMALFACLQGCWWPDFGGRLLGNFPPFSPFAFPFSSSSASQCPNCSGLSGEWGARSASRVTGWWAQGCEG